VWCGYSDKKTEKKIEILKNVLEFSHLTNNVSAEGNSEVLDLKFGEICINFRMKMK